MAGRGRRGDSDALNRIATVLEHMTQNQGNEPAEYKGFMTFRMNQPPKFDGNFDPEGARSWLVEIEKIFEAMGCLEEHKVTYATFMLMGEAEHWWRLTKPALPAVNGIIAWDAFKEKFLSNYFPRDLRKQKAKEFLELKQGYMTVGDYTAKFNELLQYWSQYQGSRNEEELCTQYENGLRAEIQEAVCHLEISDFNTLVSKCRIFENKHKAKEAEKSGGPVRNKPFSKEGAGKIRPYSEPTQTGGGKSVVKESNTQSGGYALKCYRCGGEHLRRNCPQRQPTQSWGSSEHCYVCGKTGHIARNCWYAVKPTESGSVQQSANRGLIIPPRSNTTTNTNPNRTTSNSVAGRPKVPTRVFAMTGEETTENTDEVRALRGKGKA